MNPIILLHGALGCSTQLLPLANKLEESGRTVFLFNFSGHGNKSYSAQGFGIEVFANDLLEFLNTQKVNQVDIFGYSMGGYVALWFASQHPDRVGKIITLGTKFDWSPSSAQKEISKMNPEKIEEKVPVFARLLQHRHAHNDWKLLMNRTATMMFDLGQKSLLTEDKIKKISASTLLLLGDKDDMADLAYSKQVADWLPNGDFKLLENTPHPIEKVDIELLLNLIAKKN